MQTILHMAVKDLRLLARDKLGMFFIVVFPVVMGVFFGLINASFSDEPDEHSLHVALVDLDESHISHLFRDALADVDALRLKESSYIEAVEDVRMGSLLGLIEIPEGFSKSAGIFWADAPTVRIGVDPARKAEGAMMQGMIMQAMGAVLEHRFRHPTDMRNQLGEMIQAVEAASELPGARRALTAGLLRTVDGFLASLSDQVAALEEDPGEGAESTFAPTLEIVRIESVDVTATPAEGSIGALVSKLKSPWDISFPSAIMWGVMACVAGFAVTIAKERQAGTFFRLRIAPITRTAVLAGKAMACFIAVLCVIAFMVLLGLILGIQLARPDLLILAALCTATCFVGLMMLMSVLGKTEQSVAGAGWAIIVVMCMFGGGMVPLAFMPSFMKSISHASPVKWGILVLEGAIWRGFTLGDMLVPCGILLGIGVTTFLLGTRILSRSDL